MTQQHLDYIRRGLGRQANPFQQILIEIYYDKKINERNQRGLSMSYTAHASYVRINNEKEYVCYNTCFKLVKNLLKNDDKFKTIKLSNPKIHERIVQVNNGAAVDYLIKVGFEI